MIGRKFGMLTVIERADDAVCPSGSKHKRYKCLCNCGNETIVLKEHLTSSRTKSCGCMKKNNKSPYVHGEIHTRLYTIWGNMVNRCTNPNNPAYQRYGGRGIEVCREWMDYLGFSKWAKSNGYNDELTIDRIDNDCGYNPKNCRWVDRYEQANNKRSNRMIEYHGETKTAAEWAKYIGMPYKTFINRVYLGWDIERVFEQPLRKSPTKNSLPNEKDG